LEITILVAIISAILGPLIVTKYKAYLDKKAKKEDPIFTTLKANSLVDDLLEQIKQDEKADRVWISQFHNGGNFYPTGKSISKFSVMFEHSSPGIKTIQETFTNIPVSLFNRPLMQLYTAGEILIPAYTKDMDFGLKTFAEGLETKSSYIFSLKDLNGNFVGTLGVEWTTKPKKLNETSIDNLRTKAISIGTILSTYLYTTQNK
jgi:hypothetical protein